MPNTLDILNPLHLPAWDDLVLGHPEGTIFHTAAWARVLHDSYGYTPVYFVSLRNNTLETLIPFMDVRSILTGRRGVSLPFTDYCRSILPSGLGFHEVFSQLVDHGARLGWKSMELRSDTPLPPGVPASAAFLRHTLDLTAGESGLYSNLRDSTRRNIRKAVKSGVTVTLETSTGALREFYRLNCITRRTHGVPPQPFRFFEKLHEHVLSTGLGSIFLARAEGRVVAGAVFLTFGPRAVYKYGASDRRFQHLRANNLVMWEAVRRLASQGCGSLCFGRTEPDNAGLLQFKQGWSAAGETLSYCRYDLKRRRFVPEQPLVPGLRQRIFQAMPVPLLRLTGQVLYRHAG